jgi:polygalacturonase
MLLKLLCLFLLLLILASFTTLSAQSSTKQPRPTQFNIRDYGAVGDGKALDTPAINRAIEAAAAAGGGTVLFPAGTYASFSIHLQSNIALYLDQGATLLAADPAEGRGQYDLAEASANTTFQDFGHSHWHNSLIWGENLENVSILGPGMIYGKGLTRDTPRKEGIGNKTIALKLCRNVLLRDFTVLQGGHFVLLATGVDNMTIDNLRIDTNRDGLDIDCCRNVRVSNCTVNSPFDDAICLKSSFGLGYARTTENVTITNCQVSGYDRGTLLNGTYQRKEADLVPDHDGVTGRIKFGTESNGGFKNVTVSNCVFDFCRGLALETVDGGILEDVSISNLTMRDLSSSPIFLRLGARMRGPAGTPVGALRRINISNIVVHNADPRYPAIISGIPGHPIEDVQISNVRMYYAGGGTTEQAKIQVPEEEKAYPDPVMFGTLPVYGFYIRHARNVDLRNVELRTIAPDQRPAVQLEDVQGATFESVKMAPAAGVPAFVLRDVENISLQKCTPGGDKLVKKAARKEL